MKVRITPPTTSRKTYVNLPEREPHKREVPRAPEPEETELVEQEVNLDKNWDLESNEETSSHWAHSRWSKLYFVGAILLLAAAGYLALGFEQDLRLERIVVEGAVQLTEKEIIGLAEIDRDQRFYDIDLKSVTSRLMKHSLVKAAYPSRQSNPATIVLKIEERRPVAMMRAQNGEAMLIDESGKVLRPKRISGLKDPEAMLNVPLLSGIVANDTASYLAMTALVIEIGKLDSGALMRSIEEFKKTPTGAYVLYTAETRTPIFLGAPTDEPFIASIEHERDPEAVKVKKAEPLFDRQVRLLSGIWKTMLRPTLLKGQALYVDARFDGQVIVKPRGGGKKAPDPMAGSIDSTIKVASVNRDPSSNGDEPLVLTLTKQSVNSRPTTQGH